MRNQIKTIFLFVTYIFTQHAFADGKTPSLFLNVGGGMVTHKSKLVQSNDTTTSVQYSFGIHGGSDNDLAFLMSTNTLTTAFELNSSSIASSFQDTTIRYYLGPFYLGAIFSQSNFLIEYADENIELDALGSGYGANFGLEIEFGRGNMLFLDGRSVSTSVIKEANGNEFTVGSRTEFTLGGKFPITRSLINGQVGYTQRSYTLTLDSTSYAELNTITWLGLGFDWYF